jgi:hypothetical protein
LGQNAKDIFGDVFGWLCLIGAPLAGYHRHSQMICARLCRLLCPKVSQELLFIYGLKGWSYLFSEDSKTQRA